MPVAFAGVVPSTHVRNAGYICRVGVLKPHCGQRLQLRLMRAIELRARRDGWSCMVSDTTQNIPSANNFIRAGYRLYLPRYPWAYADTLYWRKLSRDRRCCGKARLIPFMAPIQKGCNPQRPNCFGQN